MSVKFIAMCRTQDKNPLSNALKKRLFYGSGFLYFHNYVVAENCIGFITVDPPSVWFSLLPLSRITKVD